MLKQKQKTAAKKTVSMSNNGSKLKPEIYYLVNRRILFYQKKNLLFMRLLMSNEFKCGILMT